MYKPVTSGEFGDPSAGAASGRYSGPKGGRRASGHDSESGRFLDEESGGQREESSSFVIKTSRRAMLATGVLLAVCAITGVAVSSKKAQAKRLAQKVSALAEKIWVSYLGDNWGTLWRFPSPFAVLVRSSRASSPVFFSLERTKLCLVVAQKKLIITPRRCNKRAIGFLQGAERQGRL